MTSTGLKKPSREGSREELFAVGGGGQEGPEGLSISATAVPIQAKIALPKT